MDLPTGTSCFIDTNIYVYHFASQDREGLVCTNLLTRVATGEVVASVSVPILADALHKVMLLEASERFSLTRTGLVAWLQRHRDRICELTETIAAAEQLRQLPLRVLPQDCDLLCHAMRLSGKYGLLTSDAMIIAMMERHGLRHLVTNDDDFDAVPDITVWKPR